jgi:hypothetical protein
MSRHLPEFPNLDHLKKQARELLRDLRTLSPDARLSDAQRVLARQYGFAGWPQLKANVEGLGLEKADRRAVADFVKGLARRSLARVQAEHAGGAFARYTEAARRSIFLARLEAHRHGSDSIGAEHLLLGLLRAGGTTARVFERSGLSIERIRDAVEVRISQRTRPHEDPPLRAECRDALKHAAAEAEHLGHASIDAPHLLLGLLATECVAGSVLLESGMRPDEARRDVAAILAEVLVRRSGEGDGPS